MNINIQIEKKHFYIIVGLIAVFGILLFAFAAEQDIWGANGWGSDANAGTPLTAVMMNSLFHNIRNLTEVMESDGDGLVVEKKIQVNNSNAIDLPYHIGVFNGRVFIGDLDSTFNPNNKQKLYVRGNISNSIVNIRNQRLSNGAGLSVKGYNGITSGGTGEPFSSGIYSYNYNGPDTYAVYGEHGGNGWAFYANSGSGNFYGSTSSIRWKHNITEIDDALGKVMLLRGVYFNWDEERNNRHDMGFIAEEIGKVVPEVVTYEEDGVYASGLDYGGMTPILLQAIKDLKNEKDDLQDQVEELTEIICEIRPESNICD